MNAKFYLKNLKRCNIYQNNIFGFIREMKTVNSFYFILQKPSQTLAISYRVIYYDDSSKIFDFHKQVGDKWKIVIFVYIIHSVELLLHFGGFKVRVVRSSLY